MPELPEVETSRAGIAPYVAGKCFKQVIVRDGRLRWPVPPDLPAILPGLRLDSVGRRGKYLLLATSRGTLLLHLGMSGNLRITAPEQAPGKHDHLDFIFADDTVLRFNDQRRFGAALWCTGDIARHPLLADLGPEPLTDAFDGAYLAGWAGSRGIPVKSLLMDSHIVVGVGNIYANEALFLAGIRPDRPAGQVTPDEYRTLAHSVKQVLQQAIAQGGTTLRDFTDAHGRPGYFRQALNVYGRGGQPCLRCGAELTQLKIAQRASYYCPACQR